MTRKLRKLLRRAQGMTVLQLGIVCLVSLAVVASLVLLAVGGDEEDTRPWKPSAARTTCGQWSGKMTSYQQTEMARHILDSHKVSDNDSELTESFRTAISQNCHSSTTAATISAVAETARELNPNFQ